MPSEKDHRREFLTRQSRVRGMLLGLAIGDTLGAAGGKVPVDGPLRAGVSTQLACFTVEGSIRAIVRGSHKGICHPPSVILHAYCRWAALQGIETERMRRRWTVGAADTVWPDGWLTGVPALAERRGSAPATVAALSRIEEGQERMATGSRGCHALTRSLPLAAVGPGAIAQAGEIAALTHGDPAARSATVHATALLHHCLTHTLGEGDHPSALAPSTTAVLQEGIARLSSVGGTDDGDELARLSAALRDAVEQPADLTRLARLAPDPTAPSALFGGLYTAASFPARADIGAALHFAAAAPDGDSVACVTGALLGAVHGADALPVGLVSRHELAWVLDTLARDLLTELTDSPSGSEYVPGWDPHWWSRYPGW
ncbi:ADP-ribosylglycohydrolase family protein [Streptomyces sp. NPDC059894]|uniref:ADP-ribosylglycohydrolase family protein n=1 Tax=unclassified Streptomyces TaxID=2593676 RepID=UPI003664FEFC